MTVYAVYEGEASISSPDNGGGRSAPAQESTARTAAYGIALIADGECVRIIGELCTDRAPVEELVALFNEEGLDPIHLDQAVEDFLYDFEP